MALYSLADAMKNIRYYKINSKRSYYNACELDPRLPEYPEFDYRDFPGWIEYLNVKNIYYDLKECRKKARKYINNQLFIHVDKICDYLCEIDKLFPPSDLWLDYYKVDSLNKIFKIYINIYPKVIMPGLFGTTPLSVLIFDNYMPYLKHFVRAMSKTHVVHVELVTERKKVRTLKYTLPPTYRQIEIVKKVDPYITKIIKNNTNIKKSSISIKLYVNSILKVCECDTLTIEQACLIIDDMSDNIYKRIIIDKTLLKTDCVKFATKTSVKTDDILVLESKVKSLLTKYLGFYLLAHQSDILQCNDKGNDKSNENKLNMTLFKQILIKIPPIMFQLKIIEFCDSQYNFIQMFKKENKHVDNYIDNSILNEWKL